MAIHLNVKNPKQHGSNHANGTDDIPLATSDSKGLLPALSGNINEYLSGTGVFASVSGGTTNVNITESTTLTTEQMSGTTLTNYGQTDDIDLTIIDPTADVDFKFVVSTPGLPITFKSNAVMYLDGNALDPGSSITWSSPTTASAIHLYAILVGVDTYAIVVEKVNGSWASQPCLWNDDFNYADGLPDDEIWDYPSGSAFRISSNQLLLDESLAYVKVNAIRNLYETYGDLDIAVDHVVKTSSDTPSMYIGILLTDSPVMNKSDQENMFFIGFQYTGGSNSLYTAIMYGPHGDSNSNFMGTYIGHESTVAGHTGTISLRLTRSGNTIRGYSSINGTDWVLTGTYTGAEVVLPRYFGLYGSKYAADAPNVGFDNFRFMSICPGSYERVDPDITDTFWEANDEYAEWTTSGGITGWGAYDSVPGGFVSIAPVGDWSIDYRPTTVTIHLYDYCYQFKLLDTDGNIIASTVDIRYEEGVVDLGDNNKWGVTLPITWQGYDIASAQIGDGLYGILYYIEFGPAVPTLNAVSPDYWHPADEHVKWDAASYQEELIGWGCFCYVEDTDGWLSIAPLGSWPDGYRPSHVTFGTGDYVSQVTMVDTTGNDIAVIEFIRTLGTNMECENMACYEMTIPINWKGHDIDLLKFKAKGDFANYGLLYKVDFLNSEPASTIPGVYIAYDEQPGLYKWDGDSTSILELAPTIPGTTYRFQSMLYTNNKIFIGTDFGALYKWDGVDDWVLIAAASTETRITSLCMFDGSLYAGTYPNGKLYRLSSNTSSNSWEEVAPNVAAQIDSINQLFVYNDELYGTGWWDSGQLVKWNGTDAWEIKTSLDTTTADAITNVELFNDEIYAVSGNLTNLVKWNGTDAWVEVAEPYGGDEGIFSMTQFNGKLYAGTVDDGFLLEWNGTNAWVKVADTLDENWYIYRLFVYNNELHALAGDPDAILKWNGTDAWEYVVSTDGIGDSYGAWKVLVVN